ncbi:MAG: FIST N-terminal domain-containing protein [Actinomycetota bacterium]
MAVKIAVGLSESFDAVEAFSEASRDAARKLGAPCDLCLLFAGAPHLGHGKWILSTVHEQLEPRHLIGCGAGGVVAAGREIEEGPAAAVWAASMPEAEISTHHFEVEQSGDGFEVLGVPEMDELGQAMILLADPYSFATEALLDRLSELRPSMPVLGGLASASAVGSASLFRNGDVLGGGAVACSLSGVSILPCVSQGAAPVGPEMTITAAHDNVIEELASRPAIERLREALGGLDAREQQLAASGLMLGIVIDENKPEYERGDFLVRPIIAADSEAGTIALGERIRVGQSVRMHIRDGASADEDLRAALGTQAEALGSAQAAGALLFTCNGRGSHMFEIPDHDARALEDALGVPAGGFFCAGEIGPVGGRNFLHGFTATMAVFAAE